MLAWGRGAREAVEGSARGAGLLWALGTALGARALSVRLVGPRGSQSVLRRHAGADVAALVAAVNARRLPARPDETVVFTLHGPRHAVALVVLAPLTRGPLVDAARLAWKNRALDPALADELDLVRRIVISRLAAIAYCSFSRSLWTAVSKPWCGSTVAATRAAIASFLR